MVNDNMKKLNVGLPTTIPRVSEHMPEIIAYIESLRTSDDPGGWALGRFGPVTEGLFVWIGGMLLAVILAIWIGAKVR